MACAEREQRFWVASTSPGLSALGAWLEQLMAESTGKAHPKTGQGTGLIPIDNEKLGKPDSYGSDRLFVYAAGERKLLEGPKGKEARARVLLEGFQRQLRLSRRL